MFYLAFLVLTVLFLAPDGRGTKCRCCSGTNFPDWKSLFGCQNVKNWFEMRHHFGTGPHTALVEKWYNQINTDCNSRWSSARKYNNSFVTLTVFHLNAVYISHWRRPGHHAWLFLPSLLPYVHINILVHLLSGQNHLEQSLLPLWPHWISAHTHGWQQILVR